MRRRRTGAGGATRAVASTRSVAASVVTVTCTSIVDRETEYWLGEWNGFTGAPRSAVVAYTLRPHTADVAVEGTGSTLANAFTSVADGLAAACCDPVPDGGERFGIDAAAESPEALLYEYCADLIYQRDVRGELPVDNTAGVTRHGDDWRLAGSARGVPLDRIDAREVKAVTYSDMELAETSAGWRAYVVFDV